MNARSEKILVVEGNEHYRLSLCEFLQSLGYKIFETNNVTKVLEIAPIEFPGLIYINLSDEKDLEVIYKIRQKKELADIPILTSSADGSYGIELYANIDKFGNDFIGYITKPNNFAEIADHIDLILSKKNSSEIFK